MKLMYHILKRYQESIFLFSDPGHRLINSLWSAIPVQAKAVAKYTSPLATLSQQSLDRSVAGHQACLSSEFDVPVESKLESDITEWLC
jgi:hypothetical protein